MLVIRLLGRPRLERDGELIAAPRGTKSWALLARLVRSADPVSRQTLVDELFSEADDPMGALRWTLAELRRRTGLPDAFTGNPLTADLGPDVIIDVAQIARGAAQDAPPAGRLLEGVDVRDSATFETWLLGERQRVDTEVIGAMRQEALRALSRRDHERAISFARAMVQRAPLDEGAHVLLIKAIAASGDADGATAQVDATDALFRRELGVPPSAAIRDASRASVAAPLPGVSPRASCESLRAAGLAALSAGASDAGVECLRGAAAAAELAGDPELLSECLLELGTAFVHAVRGYDDEGSIVLAEAVDAATRAGNAGVASRALAELGYVDLLFGRRLSAVQRLERAREVADGDPALIATVASFEGTNLNDWGKIDEAVEHFRESIELSRRVGKARRESWALGLGSRSLYALGHYEEAAEWAALSTQIAFDERWPAFRPWSESWSGHIDLALGKKPEDVRERLEGTFALSRQLQDACWEGVSAKALGLTYAAEGKIDLANDWLHTATGSCRRVTDSYRWVGVEIQVTEAELAQRVGDTERALSLAEGAIGDSTRFSMDALLARASTVAEASR